MWKQLLDNGVIQANLNSIKSYLSEDVEVQKNELITYSRLANLIGRNVVGQIDEILKSVPGLDWVRIALSTNGLDFANPEFVAGLQDLSSSGLISQELASSLLSIGKSTVKRYKTLGHKELPSDQELQKIVDILNNTSWDKKQILLTVNILDTQNIYFNSNKATTINGQTIIGDTIERFSKETANDRQKIFIEKLLKLIEEF